MFCVSVRLIFSKFGNAEFGKLNSYSGVHSVELSVADADSSTTFYYNDDVGFYSRPSLNRQMKLRRYTNYCKAQRRDSKTKE
jgi:hypothetical protein